MAAEQTTQTPSPPKTFTLAGRELKCFQAGEQMGVSKAMHAQAQATRQCAEHLNAQLADLRQQLLEHKTFPMPSGHPMRDAVDALPTLAQPLVQQGADSLAQGGVSQHRASQIMGEVALMATAREQRWRPPLRAWALLAVVMTIATTVSTFLAIAFLH